MAFTESTLSEVVHEMAERTQTYLRRKDGTGPERVRANAGHELS